MSGLVVLRVCTYPAVDSKGRQYGREVQFPRTPKVTVPPTHTRGVNSATRCER